MNRFILLSMYLFRVGKLYQTGKTKYVEGFYYNFKGNGHELILYISNPTLQEKFCIQEGEPSFKILVKYPILFFFWKFVGMPWKSIPYSWWMIPVGDRYTPHMFKKDDAAAIRIVLVNADNGIIEVIRFVPLPQDLRINLYNAINEQYRKEITFSEYQNAIKEADIGNISNF